MPSSRTATRFAALAAVALTACAGSSPDPAPLPRSEQPATTTSYVPPPGTVAPTYYYNPACPSPTVTLCRDSAYCREVVFPSQCARLLADATDAVVTAYAPSGRGLVGLQPKNDMRLLPLKSITVTRSGGTGSFGSLAAAGSLTYSPNVKISAQSGGWFASAATGWASYPGIASCEQWVQKAYGTLYQVEALVAAREQDPLNLASALVPYQGAWLGGPYAIWTETENFHPGTDVNGNVVPIPKNELARTAQHLISDLRYIGGTDTMNYWVPIPSDIQGWLQAIAGMTQNARPSDQYALLNNLRAQGYSYQYLREVAGLQRQFIEVLAARDAYYNSQSWTMCLNKDTLKFFPCRKDGALPNYIVNKGLQVMDNRMFQMIRQAKSLGCLETAAGPCDISPESVAELARKALVPEQTAREREYQRCQTYTVWSSSPWPTGSLHPKCEFNDVVAGRTDISPDAWPSSVSAFSSYLYEADKYAQWKAAEQKRIKAAKRTNDPRPGFEAARPFGFSKSDAQGLFTSLLSDSDTGAGYAYKGNYVVYGFDAELCGATVEANLQFGFGAKFVGIPLASFTSEAHFSASRSGTFASAGANIQSLSVPFSGTSYSWSTVLNGEVQETVQDVSWSGSNTGSTPWTGTYTRELKSVDQWITVVFVPVHLYLGALGEIGSTALEQSTAFQCALNSNIYYPSMNLHYRGGPMMRAYARGSATADIGVASAGLYGELDLVRLDFKEKVDTSFGVKQITNQDLNYSTWTRAVEHDASLDVGFSTLNGVLGVSVDVDVPLVYHDTFDFPILRWGGLGSSARVGTMDGIYSMDQAMTAIYGGTPECVQ